MEASYYSSTSLRLVPLPSLRLGRNWKDER